MRTHFKYLLDTKTLADDMGQHRWDIFLSAYNPSERVCKTYDLAEAGTKRWLVHPEYNYDELDLRHLSDPYLGDSRDEGDWVIGALAPYMSQLTSGATVGIDITGMMRPHILYLMAYLEHQKIFSFDFIYTEPLFYKNKSETRFALKIEDVKPVAGYEGLHPTAMSDAVLVVGAGYDHEAIGELIIRQSAARIITVNSLPSLSADMYQESVIRVARIPDLSIQSHNDVWHASASDPFCIASNLSFEFDRNRVDLDGRNVYLCPLATKPQAVGFGLFYLRELRGRSCSMVLPKIANYERDTSSGIGRRWKYPIFLGQD